MPYHLATRARLYKMLATGFEPAILCSFCIKTLSTGFEPVTSRLTVAHSNQLSYERNGVGSRNQGSNSGQLEFSNYVNSYNNLCKLQSNALPTELSHG